MSKSIEEMYREAKAAAKAKYGDIVPSYEKPVFPGDLSALSDERIVDLLAQFASWQAYAATQAGEADADRKFAETMLKQVRQEKTFEVQQKMAAVASAKDIKKYTVDAEVDGDPEVVKWRDKYAIREAAYKMESSYRDAFEKYCFVLSRELTRRISNNEMQGRSDKMGYSDFHQPTETDMDRDSGGTFDDWED